MAHRHNRYYSIGIGMYRQRFHLLVSFLIIILPVIFLYAAKPIGGFATSEFVSALGFSTLRLIIAYGLSVFIALFATLFLMRGKMGNIFLPLFDVLQSFPTFAILPLSVAFWGPSEITVIFFLVLTVIWPMLFSLISALKLVRDDWQEAAKIYGATGWKGIVFFELPLMYPALITGTIVGLGDGWEALIGSEIIIGLKNGGLGLFFNQYTTDSQTIFIGVFALLLVIFTINKIIWLPLLERSHRLLAE